LSWAVLEAKAKRERIYFFQGKEDILQSLMGTKSLLEFVSVTFVLFIWGGGSHKFLNITFFAITLKMFPIIN
jgi:hypothetical protein